MRKLIIATLLVASIWAYPEKYDFDVNFNEIQILNAPDIQVPEAVSFTVDLKCIMAMAVTHDQKNINDCADRGLADVNEYVEELEPIPLDPYHAGFSYKLIINYHGELDLKNGEVNGVSSLHRIADALLTLTLTSGDFMLPLQIDDLSIYYDYSAKIMNLGPTGGIEGRAKNIKLVLHFGYDTNKKEVFLNKFEITDAGKIDFVFTGNKLVDWLLQLLTDTVASLLQKSVINFMEKVVKEVVIDNFLEEINSQLQSIPDVLAADKPLQNPN